MGLPFSRTRGAWWAAGAVLGLVLTWIVLTFVGTVVLGLFFYYVARPAYKRLRQRTHRNLAAAIALVALAVPIVLLMAYTFAVTVQELRRLGQNVDFGPFAEQIEPYIDVSTAVQDPAAFLQNPDVVNAGQLFATGILDYLPLVGSALVNLFLALAIAFYLLRDGSKLRNWVHTTFGDDHGVFETYWQEVDEDLGSVFFGNILNAIITAGIAVVVYYTLNLIAPASGIPYPALLGVLTGAASLIPVVGMKLVYLPVWVGLLARSVLMGEPLWFPILFIVAVGVLVDFIPDLLLRPYVSGKNLHVGLVMIACVVGPLLFGWYGLFLGPLLLVLMFHFGRHILPTLVSTSPAGVDTGDGTAQRPPQGPVAEPEQAGDEQTPPDDGHADTASDEGKETDHDGRD
jgi:predicted PurR-regulated permease PerM